MFVNNFCFPIVPEKFDLILPSKKATFVSAMTFVFITFSRRIIKIKKETLTFE